MTLTVGKPTLDFEGSGGAAFLEKPVTITIAPVGADAPALSSYGVLPYRRLTSSSPSEVWDDGKKAWGSDPGTAVADLKPIQLAFKDGEAEPWQGLIVAAGGKDGAGQPQFAKAVGGYPIYSFRGVFLEKETTMPTLGDASDNLSFVAIADKNLAVIGPGPDEMPDAATMVRLILKDSALAEIGQVVIERNGATSEVTIANSAGASVVLKADGSIELNPASSRSIVVNGDLDAQKITYLHNGGGSRLTL